VQFLSEKGHARGTAFKYTEEAKPSIDVPERNKQHGAYFIATLSQQSMPKAKGAVTTLCQLSSLSPSPEAPQARFKRYIIKCYFNFNRV
jgi:hypothetical protein